jgi:potassium efflux system protein
MRVMRFFLSFFLLLIAGQPLYAGPLDVVLAPKPAASSAANPPANSNEERSRLLLKLQQAEQQQAALATLPEGLDKSQRSFWLDMAAHAYRSHLASLTALQALVARAKDEQLQLAGGKPANETELRKMQQLGQRAIDNLDRRLAIRERGMDVQRDELQRAQAEQRKRQEQLEALPPQSAKRADALRALELAQIKTNAWSATVGANDAMQRYVRARLQEQRKHELELDNLSAEQVRNGLDDAQLQQERSDIEQKQQQYNQLRDQLEAEASRLHGQLDDARQTSERLQNLLNDAADAEKPTLAPRLQAALQQQQLLQQTLETNALRSSIVSDLTLATMLQRVFLYNRQGLQDGKLDGDLLQLQERTRSSLQSLRDTQQAMQTAAEITADQLSQLQSRTPPADAEQIRQWRLRNQTYQQAATELRRVLQTFDRWLDESAQENSSKTIAMRADYWTDKARDALVDGWNFELFSVDETMNVDGQNVIIKRSVTVGKVLVAVLLVTLGFAACIWLANRIEGKLAQRTGIAVVSIRIGKRWTLSVIFIILLLNALSMVRIPLTAFAFLGGAIAIGLGFGTQTLLKNLISGLMMLVERPFKPGDTVEVGGLRGTVVDMNVRAAVLRDINGIETLVPNATFLEQNVTNWTYSSNVVRQGVKVGVAYGSDVRQVAKLLEEDVLRHGQTLKENKPEILLENFGPDALEFGVYYWIDIGAGTVGRQVASDLRFMIEASLRKNGINIAFPQRDLHVDMSGPIKVQLHSDSNGPTPNN